MPDNPQYLTWERMPRRRKSTNVPTKNDDLAGEIFGPFKVGVRTWRGQRINYYQCHCAECGREHILSNKELKSGAMRKCTDDNRMPPLNPPQKQIPLRHKQIMYYRKIEKLSLSKTALYIGCNRSYVASIQKRYKDYDDSNWLL